MPRTRWAGRQHFTEVAEALKIPNDLVIAAMDADGQTYAFFSLTDEGEWWSAILSRDADGILRERSRRELTDLRQHVIDTLGADVDEDGR